MNDTIMGDKLFWELNLAYDNIILKYLSWKLQKKLNKESSLYSYTIY